MKLFLTAIAFTLIWTIGAHAGVTPPFTEDFATGPANWRDASGLNVLDWNSAGGPDGGAFAGTVFNFAAVNAGDTPVLFRAHDEFNSSGGAFVGDWVTNDIAQFSAFVRHDAPAPVNFFVRFAGPANFPGANKVFFTPVVPNTWTSLAISLPDPLMIFEGPFTHDQVFSNIGHVQIGMTVPESLAGVDQSFQFALDKVSIVPEPASLALLLTGAAMLLHGRKGRGRTP